MYRMEQLKAKEQLFSSIQFLTDLVQMIPSKRLQHESHGGDVELREGSPGLHEMPGVPGLLELEPDSTPLPLQNRQGKKKVTLSVDSNVSSSGMGASDGIPCFNDLEKRMLKEVTYSSHSIRGLKGTPFGEASGKSEGSEFADADEMQPVAPSASAPAAPATERDPPMLQVSKAKTDFSPMKRRGSTLQHLTRHSQNQILATSGHHAESPVVCEIFVENIGVSLWLNCSNSISLLIILLNLCHLVLAVVLYAQGHQRSGEQWTAMSLLLFSAVAVLLLQLVKRSLYSEDLNRAVQQLDDFVKDCGHGLNWSSVAQKYWCRFVCLWATLLVAFVIEQALEVWAADGFWDWSVGARVRVLKAVTSFVLFAVSSAVVMNGAYFQFNLLLGLGKTLDCWCSDLIESQDFTSGIESWNSIQALLKCVGREITPCFTASILLGYVGFFASLAGSFSLLLDDDMEAWKVALYESALLPLLYLFFLSASLFAKGASLSEKCRQVPAFVNQLHGNGADTDRQYLVRYISDSAAGFIIHGATLSQSVFLRQMHFLTAIVSGVTGILVRRYLWSWTSRSWDGVVWLSWVLTQLFSHTLRSFFEHFGRRLSPCPAMSCNTFGAEAVYIAIYCVYTI